MGNNVTNLNGTHLSNPPFTQASGFKEKREDGNVGFQEFVEDAVFEGVRKTHPKANNQVDNTCMPLLTSLMICYSTCS